MSVSYLNVPIKCTMGDFSSGNPAMIYNYIHYINDGGRSLQVSERIYILMTNKSRPICQKVCHMNMVILINIGVA